MDGHKLGLRGKGIRGSTIQQVFGLFEVGGLFHRYARLKRHRDRCRPVAEFFIRGINAHHLLGAIS